VPFHVQQSFNCNKIVYKTLFFDNEITKASTDEEKHRGIYMKELKKVWNDLEVSVKEVHLLNFMKEYSRELGIRKNLVLKIKKLDDSNCLGLYHNGKIIINDYNLIRKNPLLHYSPHLPSMTSHSQTSNLL
jgi:DNA phosphorothioation-dependent restriction protein DptG